MQRPDRAIKVLGTSAFVLWVGFADAPAFAAVPATYKGTPYMGTPWPIPGRINLINYDLGGLNVAFFTVHHGDVGCAGGGYRTDLPTGTLCKTSALEKDVWVGGPANGTQYPSATTADYYVGAIRPGDWVKITVNVMTAGTYMLSSTWASAGGSIDMKISFNDVLKNETKLPATGGYHSWVPYPNYGMVQLDAGIQVMEFQSVVEHINFDYVQFSLVTADGGVDPGNADGGPVQTGSDAAASDGTIDSSTGSDASTGSIVGTSGDASGSLASTGSGASTGASTGVAAGGGAPSGSGMSATGSVGSTGSAGRGGAAGPGPRNPAGCACAEGVTPPQTGFGGQIVLILALALGAPMRMLRRRRGHCGSCSSSA